MAALSSRGCERDYSGRRSAAERSQNAEESLGHWRAELLADEFSDMKHERGVVSTVSIPGQAQQRWRAVLRLRLAAAGARWQVFRLWPGDRGHGCGGEDLTGSGGADGFADKPGPHPESDDRKEKEGAVRRRHARRMRRTVTMKTTLGTIKIKMEPDWAPEHVRNFLKLTSTRLVQRHGVSPLVKGFVVQGGWPMRAVRADIRPIAGFTRQRRIPRRCETHARDRVDGARRRSGFGHHLVSS